MAPNDECNIKNIKIEESSPPPGWTSLRWLLAFNPFLSKLYNLVGTTADRDAEKFHDQSLKYMSGKIRKTFTNRIAPLISMFSKGGDLDESEADYLSRRVAELKSNEQVNLRAMIKREDWNYYFVLSAMASEMCYEKEEVVKSIVEEHWKMKLVKFCSCSDETEVMVILDENKDRDTYVVAFRGTEIDKSKDVLTDLDFAWHRVDGIGKMHRGFQMALGLQNDEWPEKIKLDEEDDEHNHRPPPAYYFIREDILRERVLGKNKETKFILTGHSLGGALAIVFATILFYHKEKDLLERLDGIYTFGQPNVGDEDYVKYMTQKLEEHKWIKYYRFVYCYDFIARLPPDSPDIKYKYFGKCIFFNRRYEAKVVENPPDLFVPWAIIPRIWDAFGQIKQGRHNGEGWVAFYFRITQSHFTDHICQNYINCTLSRSLQELLKPQTN